MRRKIAIYTTLIFSLFSIATAGKEFDFSVRIFDTLGGERTSGTMSVNIENLKKNNSKQHQEFTQHTKDGDILTRIEITWKEAKEETQIFSGTVSQSDGKAQQEGIKIEFPYQEKEAVIYTNKFHTIKIIPNVTKHIQTQ